MEEKNDLHGISFEVPRINFELYCEGDVFLLAFMNFLG